MWYNERKGVREWFYALASCLDADIDQAADWLRTREEIMDWVRESGRFRLYITGKFICTHR